MPEGEGHTTSTEYQVEYGDSPVYRWTIRSLYVVAIGMNVYIMWQASRDDVEMAILRDRVTAWGKRIARPITVQRDWARSLNRMHRQVQWTLLEETKPDGT